jgi:rhodanese-related sulfurtransferase/membrane protein insertase Oxa1/YidC/SpoIIIJ/phosphohistidine swiveling domain-containing protein
MSRSLASKSGVSTAVSLQAEEGFEPSADPGSESRARARRILASLLACAAVSGFVVDGRAWALPSPDVVVNLFASSAQVLGLLTVILGKWFFSGRRKMVAAGAPSRAYRTAFYVSAGLCVLSLAAWGLSAAHQADLRMRRLQVNITRESKEDGRKIADLSLKETGYGEQQKRKDGIQTEWLEGSIARHEPLQMLDIRETEEVEMGVIPGVRHVRFPDLMKAPEEYLDKSRPVYLFCANGNRSAEMATFLAEKGYTSSFMIGGYEKWVAEERHLETPGGAPRTELRALPDFANKDVLLDTPDVVALMEKRDVLFVDVRYPGDFNEFGHLPGAINLTIRKLTTPELDEALTALPKKPIIVPCYDRRSSFFALILGVRISRMGGEFLGRYTVPNDFSIPKADKAHVAAWNARHQDESLLTVASAPLAGALKGIDARAGSLAISILILVALIRLAVLPLTLKSDRDRVVQARLDPKLKALRASMRDDPAGLSRSTTQLLRANKVRPFLNLAAAVAQLLLFTGFFSVVSEASSSSTQRFLWMPALGKPDPRHILPVAIAVLLVALLAVTAKQITKTRIAVMIAAGGGLFALVLGLSSGTNLYLTANLGLLVLQSAIVGWVVGAERSTKPRRRLASLDSQDVVPLRYANAVSGCGGKATRLAALIDAGMPVPDGFVVRGRAIDVWRSAGVWSADCRERITRELANLRSEKVAVRSSGLNEDGQDRSYAGVFESILDVRAEGLLDAIGKVAESLSSDRARIYSNRQVETGSIVVQTMVPAEYAGVLFTEHPGHAGSCAVELVAGLGDELVSGRVDPMSFEFGRTSGRLRGDQTPPIDLAPLLALGREVESLFGRPQDIEWAYARGRFFLLQARDITRLCTRGADAEAIRESERARLLELARGAAPEEPVFAQNELSELLPEPTPFSREWMEEMWAYGGSTDLACRSLGIPYDVLPDSPRFTVGVFGSLYVDKREEKRRLAKGPGTLAAFRLSRAHEEIERSWREDYLPGFLREMRMREAMDLSRLTFDEAVDLLRRTLQGFLTEDYVRAEIINIAADFYLKVAVRDLEKAREDPVVHLSRLPKTVVAEAMDLLARVGRGEAELSEFMSLYGHRAPQDYELSHPRFREAPELAMSMASRSVAGPVVRHGPAPTAPPTIEKRVLRLSVERASRFQALKEEAKHHSMREVAFLRSLVLEIGKRLGVGDGVFYLTPAEVQRLTEADLAKSEAAAVILSRQEAAEALEPVRLPREVTVADLELLDVEGGSGLLLAKGTGNLSGKRISGRGDVSGRVRVLRNASEIDSFQKGEILVARFTDPTWMSVFPLAGGIITEVGGWLSHAAIQAREHDITGIVGVAGALDALMDGELVSLRADGTIERFGDRRTEDRVPVSLPVDLQRHAERLEGRLADLSSHGALLHVPGRTLSLGEELTLETEAAADPLGATVVRNGIPGIYGLRFRRTLEAERIEWLGSKTNSRTVQGAA